MIFERAGSTRTLKNHYTCRTTESNEEPGKASENAGVNYPLIAKEQKFNSGPILV